MNLGKLWHILLIWLKLGLQSFGGGSATLVLIRRAAVEEHHWITEEEFTRDWSLCQIAPGINVLAMTILLGRRIAGWPGAFVSVLGLLLTSVTVTIMITAGYTRLQRYPVMQSSLHGVLPATVGLGLLTALQMARSPLEASKREGAASLILALLLMIGSGVVLRYGHVSVVFVLLGAGIIGAGYGALRGSGRKSSEAKPGSQEGCAAIAPLPEDSLDEESVP